MPEYDKKKKQLGSALTDKAMKSLGNVINASKRQKRLDKNGNIIQTTRNDNSYSPMSGQTQYNQSGYNDYYNPMASHTSITRRYNRINKEINSLQNTNNRMFSSIPEDIKKTNRPKGVDVVRTVRKDGKEVRQFKFNESVAKKAGMSSSEISKAKRWVARENKNAEFRRNKIKRKEVHRKVISIKRTITKVVHPISYGSHEVAHKISNTVYDVPMNIRKRISNFSEVVLNFSKRAWRSFVKSKIGKYLSAKTLPIRKFFRKAFDYIKDGASSAVNFFKSVAKVFNTPARALRFALNHMGPVGRAVSNFIFKKRSLRNIINPIGGLVSRVKKFFSDLLEHLLFFLTQTFPGWIVSIVIISFIALFGLYTAFVNIALNNEPYIGPYPVVQDNDVSRFLRAFTEQQIGTEFGAQKELGVTPHEVTTENGDNLYSYTPVYAEDKNILPEEVIIRDSKGKYDDDNYELGATGFLGAFRIKLPIKYPAAILLTSVEIGNRINPEDKTYDADSIFDACIAGFNKNKDKDDNKEDDITGKWDPTDPKLGQSPEKGGDFIGFSESALGNSADGYVVTIYLNQQVAVVTKGGHTEKVIRVSTALNPESAYSSWYKKGGNNIKTVNGFEGRGKSWTTLVDGSYTPAYIDIYQNVWFHSVPYESASRDDLEDDEWNKLGSPASAGCVRMALKDLRYLYNTLPNETTVIFDGEHNYSGTVPGQIEFVDHGEKEEKEESENDIQDEELQERCSQVFSKENIVNAFKYWLDHLEFKYQTLFIKWGEEYPAVYKEMYEFNFPKKYEKTDEIGLTCPDGSAINCVEGTTGEVCTCESGANPEEGQKTVMVNMDINNPMEHFINDATYCRPAHDGEEGMYRYELTEERVDSGKDEIPLYYCKDAEDWIWSEVNPGDYETATVGETGDVEQPEDNSGLSHAITKLGWMPADTNEEKYYTPENNYNLEEEGNSKYDNSDFWDWASFWDLESSAISTFIDKCTNPNSMYCFIPYAHDALEMYNNGDKASINYGGAFATNYNYSWLDIEGIDEPETALSHDKSDKDFSDMAESDPIFRKKFYWVLKTPKVAYKQLIDDYRWDKYVEKDGNGFNTASGQMTSLIQNLSSAEFSTRKTTEEDGTVVNRICYSITPSEEIGARGTNKNKKVTVDIDRLAAGWVSEYNQYISDINENDTPDINFTDINYLSTIGNIYERYEMMMNSLYPEDVTFTPNTGGEIVDPDDFIKSQDVKRKIKDMVNDGSLDMQMPINPTGCGFKYGEYSSYSKSPHWAEDLAAPQGTPIHSVCSGTVHTSSYHEVNGEYIIIHCNNDLYTYYGHMVSGSRRVSAGDSVSKGDVIGQVGMTGTATGPHIHFFISTNTDFYNRSGYNHLSLSDVGLSGICDAGSSDASYTQMFFSDDVAAATTEENYTIISPFDPLAETVCKNNNGTWLPDSENEDFEEFKQNAEEAVSLNDFSTEYEWTDFRPMLLETTGTCKTGNTGSALEEIIKRLRERALSISNRTN